MDYMEFEERLTDGVRGRLGEGYQIECRKILKNNSVKLPALSIRKDDSCVAPVIYIDNLYSEYKRGGDLEEVIDEAIALYKENVAPEGFPVGELTDFHSIKDRICYRLISHDENSEILQNSPHRHFLDLAVVYNVVLGSTRNGYASVAVTNDSLRVFGVTEEELWECAVSNTPRLFVSECRTLCEIFGELGFTEQQSYGTPAGPEIYVLSNTERLYGAACLLYEGIIKEMEEVAGEEFYILPSSVHEVLLVPKDGMDVETLRNMVHEVNSTIVSRQEILSDNVYEVAGHRISIAGGYDSDQKLVNGIGGMEKAV